MKSKPAIKLMMLTGVALSLFAALSLTPGSKHGAVSATANPPAPLLSCPIVSGNSNNTVGAADIFLVVRHFGQDHGRSGAVYWPLYDVIAPYDPANASNTGKITAADIFAVVLQFGHHCPLVDTQIAKATRAIGDPTFGDVLCDDAGTVKYQNSVNCGGSTSFLTEDATFLASRGYLRSTTDVPGQGVHYVNLGIWDDVFNPVRPPGLVYKNGVLVAQLYYAFGGDSGAGVAGVGWGSAPSSNVRAVNTDALPCTAASGAPPNTGCSWDGNYDGWHWHADLCTWAIGTPQAVSLPLGPNKTQSDCAALATVVGTTCTFPTTPPPWTTVNFNCTFGTAVGWMGHLWNWLPNANYTNAVNPGPGGYNDCQTGLCSTGESNGRFADCFPDGGSWTAYNCPQ